MGTGKKLKCKLCGAEWMVLQGSGFNDHTENREANPEDLTRCPECGSSEVEIDTNTEILWD